MSTKFKLLLAGTILCFTNSVQAAELSACTSGKDQVKLPGLGNICMNNSNDPASACLCDDTKKDAAKTTEHRKLVANQR